MSPSLRSLVRPLSFLYLLFFAALACGAEAPPVAEEVVCEAAPPAAALPCEPAAPCNCDGDAAYEWAAEPVDFLAEERAVFSSAGEDGVIEKIFSIIEPTTKYSVEFGAGNGIRASNTRNMIINDGWSSLQIEGDPARARELAKNFNAFPKVKAVEAWVWPGNIEILFEENGVPRDFDFLVIDIDSNDYYVWRAIQSFRPKVVMIEVNGRYPPPEKWVIDFHPMNYWDGTGYVGASLQTLTDLGKKKGYELIYQIKGGGNAFFVDAKYLPLFGIRDNSASAIYSPPPKALADALLADWGPKQAFLTWENLRIKKNVITHR